MDEKKNVEELKTAPKLDPQQELSAKIHKIVIEGGYPLPTFIAVVEMLKTEYMMQAYLAHMSKGAEKNLIQMKQGGGELTPEMIEKIKNSH